MDKTIYLNRLIEKRISNCMQIAGAVSIFGPRFCGKTFMCENISKSQYYLQKVNKQDLYDLLKYNSETILEGLYPRLIDEWQLLPKIWDYVRMWVDQSKSTGLFLLTGSTNVDKSDITHSGAGRIIPLEMGTMSLYESNDSSGLVSLIDLFDKKPIKPFFDKKDMKDIAYYLCRGGWPLIVSKEIENNKKQNINLYLEMLSGYLETILDFENYQKIIPTDKKKEILNEILKSISRRNTTQIKATKILEDLTSISSIKTLDNYLTYIKDNYLTNELPIWRSTNYRSKTKLLTTPKTYLCDPSLGLFVLGINHNNIFNDLNTFGIYFENLVIRDLKAYVQSIGGKLYFFRDENDFEIDVIIELNDGRWAAIEIKLGTKYIEEAAKNLLKFKQKINQDNPPAFMAVITGTEKCYQREDGIYVIPIQSLKN